MSFPAMPFLHLPRAFKHAFPDVAVLAVCRIDNLANAQQILSDGDADLVALARPHIASPTLVNDFAAPSSAPQRSCIACNQGCAGRLELGMPISCVVNPEVGLEKEWASLRVAAATNSPHRVLVVGGGPGGMEAAIAAASSGHNVTVIEASEALGGALRDAAALPTRTGFQLMIDQLEHSTRYHKVQVRLHTTVDMETIDADWDHIILATGASPARHDNDAAYPVVALHDAIGDPDLVGEHVAVIDEEGSWTALALAEHLLRGGRRVTLLCAQPALAWRIPVYSRPALLDRLRSSRFAVSLLRAPIGMTALGLLCSDPFSGGTELIQGVSAVVFIRAPSPRLQLARYLDDTGRSHRYTVVGDAYAPRTALEAAFEGRLAGLGLTDSPVARSAARVLRGRL